MLKRSFPKGRTVMHIGDACLLGFRCNVIGWTCDLKIRTTRDCQIYLSKPLVLNIQSIK